MEIHRTTVLIAGGGIAGLTAAARLGSLGLDVSVVEPSPAESGAGDDRRTTAFLQPAVATFEKAGVWARLAPEATALWTMRLLDAGGRERAVRQKADFVAREIQDRPFGYNLANTAVRAALFERLGELPSVRVLRGVSVRAMLARAREALVTLSDGSRVRARLAIAADGRNSTLRQAAGIDVRRWAYGQKALVFPVHHDQVPHEHISTEIHRTGGPLTLVPMPDLEGRPSSSVVWMVGERRADRLATLDDAALGAELTAETMGLFGPLEIAGERAVWPIITQVATAMKAERLAIAAEAAHVIPPIGAQGLNMSLADVECLARLIEDAEDPGAPALLSAYQRRRLPEVALRVGGVDLLNRFAQAEVQPLRDLRRFGLATLHTLVPLRQTAMRLGMGAGG